MGLYSYDIVISEPRTVVLTAVMASNPGYTISEVRLTARPLFSDSAVINQVQYAPGDDLISASGGTVTSTVPHSVSGATTAAVQSLSVSGSYSTSTKSAVFTVPFGQSFVASTKEHEVGGSPRLYDYEASFISSSQGATAVADAIIAGKIQVTVGREARVPASGPATYKAISVTQV